MFSSIFSFYSDSYRGKVKAWKVFVYGYLLPLIPYAIIFGIFSNLSATSGFYWLTVIRFIYNIWLIVSLWQCSQNVSKTFFNFLTKSFAILILLDSVSSIAILIH